MDASGFPLNPDGRIVLVGAAAMTVNVIFSITFTLGIELSGTLGTPLPPVPPLVLARNP